MPGTRRGLQTGGLRGGPPCPAHESMNTDAALIGGPHKMTTDTITRHNASDEDLHAIAQLVSGTRPEWPRAVVEQVLLAHRDQVDAADLAVAAIRAAQNTEWHTPKVIGWRGPHWEGARTKPNEHVRLRCSVCGKLEDRCAMDRPGLDDDHTFEPTQARVRREQAR